MVEDGFEAQLICSPEEAALVSGLMVRGGHSFQCVKWKDGYWKVSGFFTGPFILQNAYDRAAEYLQNERFKVTDPLY
jgi:hypothetical protein